MITRFAISLLFTICFNIHLFSQEGIARDADGNIWLVTDTTKKTMQYINNDGHAIEVISGKDFMLEKEKLDSLIMHNQYKLWSNRSGREEYEPYASVVYSILFSNKMKIVEVRILRREAYEKDSVIDNIIIQSIKKTKRIWNNCKHIKKNAVFVSRTKVVIPYDKTKKTGRKLGTAPTFFSKKRCSRK